MRITGHASGIDHAESSRKGISAGVLQSARAGQDVNPESAGRGMKNVLALARSLGLPADGLSALVISSARYFSLPLEPGLLATLRREVSAAGGETAAETGGDEKTAGKTETGDTLSPVREALSLGAAAAASKGVMLHREALDEYAAAIDPCRRRPPGEEKGEEGRAGNPADGSETGTDSKTGSNGGGNGNGGRSGNDGAAGTGDGRPENGGGAAGTKGGTAGGNGKSGGGTGLPGDPAAGTEALQEWILGAAEKTLLLRLLNRIPGKNGGRWIVLPFAFTEGGREYGISLRIMLEEDRCRMALDMAEKQNGETLRRKLFVMERVSGEIPFLTVSLRPGRREAELRSLKKELGAFLHLPQDHVQTKNADNKMNFSGFFPQDDLLPSVNEEV
jgi:hypothetical protein